MKLFLLALALLISAAAAESIRETETMDPNGLFVDPEESSGFLPDDEDFEEVEDYAEEGSTSGDYDDDIDNLDSTLETQNEVLNNNIPENDLNDVIKPKPGEDVIQIDNEIIVKKAPLEEANPSNEILMASTSQGFLSRTEVVIAVVAGAMVGLLFAVFIIVFLVMRIRKQKGDLAYDTVKKPIYKKAPTIEA